MHYYVYRITCTHPESVEKYYYGSRSCYCLPEDDMKYWSSSTYIKAAIQKWGISFFKKKIIKKFDTHEEALLEEIKLHERFNVARNDLFFNKCKQAKWGINCTGDVLRGRTYEEIHGSDKALSLRKMRSESLRGISHAGSKNPMYKRKHTDTSKLKMSECKQGEKHPTYGWYWINDGEKNQKVPPDYNIPNGWARGRINVHKH